MLILLILAIVFNSNTAQGVREGLGLCATVVIPSLFPLTVLALFTFNSGAYTLLAKTVGLDFTVWLLSALGGYPCGAILLERLYEMGVVDKKRAEKMLCFCVNAGPSFVVYTVGKTVLHNTFYGVLLLTVHLLPSFIFMLIIALKEKAQPYVYEQNFLISDAFVLSVRGGLEGSLSLTASITFIFALTGMLKGLLPQNIIDKIVCFFEVTYGIKSNRNNLYLTAFLLGFSGVSVILQIMSVQTKIKPKISVVFISRFLHGLTSFLLSVIAFA
ncbi:MAG: hypothetical protein KBS41_00880, partial [Oscillospiraceae bacterium]|nr:hypothetical protein [Candidatus Equicaccousia limihippi]